MPTTNSEIVARLREFGYDPPEIHEKNRMYALALVYDLETEQENGLNTPMSIDDANDNEEKSAFDNRRRKIETLN